MTARGPLAEAAPLLPMPFLAALGVLVGVGSALTGTGGPVLLLPLLMLCRQPLPFAVVAAQAIQRIAALYRVEADVRELDAAQRLQVRQRRSLPLWQALHLWLQRERARVPDGSTIAGATSTRMPAAKHSSRRIVMAIFRAAKLTGTVFWLIRDRLHYSASTAV